jgi:heat shock protein HslJ
MRVARVWLPALAALAIAGCGSTAGTVRSWLPPWMPGSAPREAQAAAPAQPASPGTTAPQGSTPAPRPGLEGSTWRLVEIAGQAVPGNVLATLAFSEPGRIAGTAGCNGYTGAARLEGGRFAVGPLATTRRACEAPAMAFEQRYLAALATAQALRRDGERLTVEVAGGAPLLYIRQP